MSPIRRLATPTRRALRGAALASALAGVLLLVGCAAPASDDGEAGEAAVEPSSGAATQGEPITSEDFESGTASNLEVAAEEDQGTEEGDG